MTIFVCKTNRLIKLGLIVYVNVARMAIDNIGLLKFVLLELLLGFSDWTFKRLKASRICHHTSLAVPTDSDEFLLEVPNPPGPARR